MARKKLIPLPCLAVLNEKELILIRRVQSVTEVALVERRDGVITFFLHQLGCSEAQGIAFIQAIAHWVAAKVVTAAASHDRPLARVAALTATTLIVSIIQVRQTQNMPKLMAEGADAVHAAVIPFPARNFGRAGIQAKAHAIQSRRPIQVIHVRPQVVLIVTAVVGRQACHQEEDHVHVAVTVGIVIAVVDFVIKSCQSGIEDLISVVGTLGITA